MLALLLDENISQEIAAQILKKRPDISIVSIRAWQNGAFLSAGDESILSVASLENLTLVTYDVNTIPPLLQQWGQSGISHTGVVFIDERAIPSNDFGGLVRALTALWDRCHQDDWMDRIEFLLPAR